MAITNTKRLIDEDKVFALIGEVGTRHPRLSSRLRRSRGCPSSGRSRALTFCGISLSQT